MCRRCGGLVKSNVISFGQPMPRDKMVEAERLALACDLFVVLGVITRRSASSEPPRCSRATTVPSW